MTVDEMIAQIRVWGIDAREYEECDKIIAALKAGQTLAYKAEAYLNLTNHGWSRPQKELTEAINAWGDATGEDK
jgi:hypothetical protein